MVNLASWHQTRSCRMLTTQNYHDQINNLVAPGLLAMPWVLQQSSVVTGLCFVGVVLVLSTYSFLMLARTCDMAGTFLHSAAYLHSASVAHPIISHASHCCCYAQNHSRMLRLGERR